MTQYRNTFDGGANGVAISAANSGGASGDAFAAAAAGMVFSTARRHEGAAAAAFASAAQASYVSWSHPATAKIAYRSYHYFTAANSGGTFMLSGAFTAAGESVMDLRLTSANLLRLYLGATTGFVWLPDVAMPVGQWVRAELLVEQGTTAANGRARAAIYLGDSPTPVIDSGWLEGLNLRAGAAEIARARFGKGNTNSNATDVYMDTLAVDIDIDYKGFIGASTPQLATPAVSITGKTNPSTVGGSNGSITIAWPPVAGAHHYEAAIASGDVVEGFVTSDANATSPKTFTGLAAGTYTVAVRAMIA